MLSALVVRCTESRPRAESAPACQNPEKGTLGQRDPALVCTRYEGGC